MLEIIKNRRFEYLYDFKHFILSKGNTTFLYIIHLDCPRTCSKVPDNDYCIRYSHGRVNRNEIQYIV